MNKLPDWWYRISTITILNFLVLYELSKNQVFQDDSYFISLIGIYLFVSIFRSYYPKKEVEKVCLYDHFMSKPVVGRTIATIAEISLILALIHIFKEISFDIYQMNTNINFVLNITLILIIVAQISCWMSVITEHFLFNLVEESLWTITFTIYTIISAINFYNITESNPKLNHISLFCKLSIPLFITYVLYMLLIDLPLYSKKWNTIDKNKDKRITWNEFYNDIHKHLAENSLYQKIMKITNCSKFETSWEEWSDEVPWMIGYFVIIGWVLIILVLWYIQYKKL
tara:strand:- start:312 stop:1163 length:852 start_codon:yes stop_codon:yes gene_type:complete